MTSSPDRKKWALRPLDRPRQLDRYELIAPIGSGGMATVYLGRSHSVGGFERLVAVKVCHLHLRDQVDFVSMFLDEARLAARVHHSNVVSTLDVRDDEDLYIVMEYIEGGHLSQLQRVMSQRHELLPIPITLRIIRDALEGLHAVHELGDNDGRCLNLIHRDISPQNILVGIDGVTKIADFGVVKTEERSTSTKPGEVKGKYPYMAPEQLRGQQLTQRVDIFSISIVLWEALTGQRLFKAESKSTTVLRVLSGPIRRPSSFRNDVLPALDDLIRRGLRRDPERRFQTARELATAIDRCGVPLASTGEVRALVVDVLGDSIQELRDVVRAAGPPPSTTKARFSEAAQPSSNIEPVLTPPDQLRRRHRSSKVLVVAMGALMIVVVAVWLVLASDWDNQNSPPADTPPVTKQDEATRNEADRRSQIGPQKRSANESDTPEDVPLVESGVNESKAHRSDGQESPSRHKARQGRRRSRPAQPHKRRTSDAEERPQVFRPQSI